MNPGTDNLTQLESITSPDLFRAILDDVSEGVYIVDRQRRIVYWNKGAERITGYLAQEADGRFCHADMLMHCDQDGNPLCGGHCPLLEVMQDGLPRSCTVFLRHRHGHRMPVNVRATAIRGANSQIVGAVEYFSSVDPGVSSTVAGSDRSSGVLSRALGESKLGHALDEFARFGIPVGWIRVDVADLVALEHRYGYGFVDAVTAVVANTLAANVGNRDEVIRWDRPGFRVLVYGNVQIKELALTLERMIENSNVEWWGDPLPISVFVGFSEARRGDTAASLEQRAKDVQADRCPCSSGCKQSCGTNSSCSGSHKTP